MKYIENRNWVDRLSWILRRVSLILMIPSLIWLVYMYQTTYTPRQVVHFSYHQSYDELIDKINKSETEFDILYSQEMVEVVNMSISDLEAWKNGYSYSKDGVTIFFNLNSIDIKDYDDLVEIISVVGKCDSYKGDIYINVAEIYVKHKKYSVI